MRCKQGDLAEIIQSEFGVSVGKIVQCIRVEGNHSLHGPVWLVRGKEKLAWESGEGGMGMDDDAHIPDAFLRPIKPPPLPEKTLKKVLEDA